MAGERQRENREEKKGERKKRKRMKGVWQRDRRVGEEKEEEN